MTALVLYDDARARRFEPFALTRPVAELRAGGEIIRRRWAHALGGAIAGVIAAPHLRGFEELDAAPVLGDDEIAAGVIVANSRFAISLGAADPDADVWMCGDRVAAVRLERPLAVSRVASGEQPLQELAPGSARVTQVGGWWLEEVWDLIRHLPAMVSEDVLMLAERLGIREGTGLTTVGAHAVYVASGATIEPHVLFDTTAGPILVQEGATVTAFTRLCGPTIVGAGSSVLGGRVAACSIGDNCRAHGELSHTIFLGHANKSHDGFVGHSYLGRWVNLGAGTITSNLKNTYGSVALWTPDGVRPTEMQFLGTFFGDHAKTAIGTRLTTGSVIGAGANVFGSLMPPKVVPPFAWGAADGSEPYTLEKFLTVAERVMARRNVTLARGYRTVLAAAYRARWGS